MTAILDPVAFAHSLARCAETGDGMALVRHDAALRARAEKAEAERDRWREQAGKQYAEVVGLRAEAARLRGALEGLKTRLDKMLLRGHHCPPYPDSCDGCGKDQLAEDLMTDIVAALEGK